jgi:hypothetical protein
MALTFLAQAVADEVATLGRQLHDGEEFQLRAQLEKVELRLNELIAALPEQDRSGARTSDGPGAEG